MDVRRLWRWRGSGRAAPVELLVLTGAAAISGRRGVAGSGHGGCAPWLPGHDLAGQGASVMVICFSHPGSSHVTPGLTGLCRALCSEMVVGGVLRRWRVLW